MQSKVEALLNAEQGKLAAAYEENARNSGSVASYAGEVGRLGAQLAEEKKANARQKV